jgi:hypothetical protein
LKKSKFVSLIAGMDDEEIKALAEVIGFRPRVITAIRFYERVSGKAHVL